MQKLFACYSLDNTDTFEEIAGRTMIVPHFIFARDVQDAANQYKAIKSNDWRYIIVWECALIDTKEPVSEVVKPAIRQLELDDET